MRHLRRVYLTVGRAISPIAIVGLRVYSLITRRPRAKIMVVNEHGEILLVKGVIATNGYWTLPGGGVNFREPSQAAARRELFEETGIDKRIEEFTYVCRIDRTQLRLGYTAEVFSVACKKSDLPVRLVNPYEIAEIAWVHPSRVPAKTTALVTTAYQEHAAHKQG